MSEAWPLPDSIWIAEVGDWRFGAGIFGRKFGADPPVEPHHIVTFHRDAEGIVWPVTYIHLRAWHGVMLVGGACTDGNVLRRMGAEERAAVDRAGGVYLHSLRWAVARFASRCEAFFGYCGDPRAMAVDLAAGFEATMHPRLIVRWHRPLAAARRAELVEAVHGLGPF